jgi:uncharacterized protein YqeY
VHSSKRRLKDRRPLTVVDVAVAARAKAAAIFSNTGRRELGQQSGEA